MGKFFKVKTLDNCRVCGGPVTGNRYRSYCSAECRNKFYNKKYYKKNQQRLTDKRAAYAPDKIRCLICGKWYYQVCSHVYHKHKMTGREYRKLHGLDVKRGLLPKFLRDIKAAHVFDNGTVDNLKAGRTFWFKSGDKRAGKYKRSAQTLSRLAKLSSFNKHNYKHKNYAKTISSRV